MPCFICSKRFRKSCVKKVRGRSKEFSTPSRTAKNTPKRQVWHRARHVSHGARKNKRDLRQEKSAPVTKSVLPLQILHCLIKTKSRGSLIFPAAEEQLLLWLHGDERFLSLCSPSLSHPFHTRDGESSARFCAAWGCPQLSGFINIDASSPHTICNAGNTRECLLCSLA